MNDLEFKGGEGAINSVIKADEEECLDQVDQEVCKEEKEPMEVCDSLLDTIKKE